MDIDLEPWLNGLNYRVVLVAGHQREWDERVEIEQRGRERQKGRGNRETRSIERISPLPCRPLSFSLFINSPPSSPVQSFHTPKQHHPGLYAVMSQLALEESAVEGLSLPIQPRLLSSKNANCMLGAQDDAWSWMQSPNDPSESVNLCGSGRPAVAVKPVWYKQLINQQSSWSLSPSRPCWWVRGLKRIALWEPLLWALRVRDIRDGHAFTCMTGISKRWTWSAL